MQVFVPFPDLKLSVRALDSRRLNKQILEATQILEIILNVPTKTGKPRTGWLNHPAVKAWEHNPGFLSLYTRNAIGEADKRGIQTETHYNKIEQYDDLLPCGEVPPVWYGDALIHESHQARLLQKGWEEKFKQHKTAEQTINWYRAQNWPIMYYEQLMSVDYKWPVFVNDYNYNLVIKASKPTLKTKQQLIETYGLNPYINYND